MAGQLRKRGSDKRAHQGKLCMNACAITLVLVSWTASASAQDTVLVLPTGSTELEPQALAPAARALRARLANRARVLSASDADLLLGQRHSVEPRAVAPDELQSLETCAQEAQEHVVYGRRAEAEATISRCIDLGGRALGNLHGESDAERLIFDSCLYRVQILLHAEERDAARNEAIRCRRLAPFAEASRENHPPWVRDLMAEVDADLQRRGSGTLHVEEAGGARCTVVANGRMVGASPVDLRDLPQGPYNIALDCSHARSRVHRVQLDQNDRTVVIDLALDAAIRTAPELMLLYPSRALEEQRRARDAQALGTAFGTREVYLVTGADNGVRVDALEIYSGNVVASAWLSAASVQAAEADPLWEQAVARLSSRESFDFRVDPPQARAAWRPNTSETPIDIETDASGPIDSTTGWILGLTGAAALAGSAIFVGLSWAADLQPTALEGAHIGLAFGGGAMLAAALPLLLEDGDLAWMWASLGAAAGVTLVAFGIYAISTPDLTYEQCAQPAPAPCRLVVTGEESDHEIGWSLVGASLPLFSLAITELVFALDSNVTVTPVVAQDGAHLHFQGTFQ
jgi:hypothetical protein